jgi:uracil-DNA glycosylase family 4
MNLAQLHEQFRHHATALHLKTQCISSGDVMSQVAVISEAPGINEVREKAPLVGGSGKLLWGNLQRIRQRRRSSTRCGRNDVYVTNVVKRMLSGPQGKENIGASELAQWKVLLMWELAQLPNLRYILILGDKALQAVMREKKINLWQGTVRDTTLRVLAGKPDTDDPVVVEKQVTCIVTWNPAACIRAPMLEPVFRMTLDKLFLVLEGRFKPHLITSHINPSPDEAMQWCEKMIDEHVPVSWDIETPHGWVGCHGFANGAHEGMCINYRDAVSNRWSLNDEVKVRKAVQAVLSHPNVKLIAQNGMFDSYVSWVRDRIRAKPVWFDTMLAHHLLYSILPHSLAFLTAQYTTHPYYKDEGKRWHESGNMDEHWEYNVKDACITWACYERLRNELRQAGLEEFFFNHVMRAQPHLVRMTAGGVLTDAALKTRIAEEMRTQVNTLREQFLQEAKACTGMPELEVNPNSPPQLHDMFYAKLGLYAPPRMSQTTDATVRGIWLDNPSVPEKVKTMLRVLNEYKTEHKFSSNYAEMNVDPDQRIRCEYKQTGVQSAPGRLSSASTAWGSGTNLQNQPERAYEMFIADPDHCLIYFDLSQAEARVVACLAKIEKWLEQFERHRVDRSYDCHRALASEMFSMPYDEVPTYDRDEQHQPTRRYIAKRCRHGLNYRMMPPKLAEVTGLPLHVAWDGWRRYHHTTPELQHWWDETVREVRSSKLLVSPMGRPLRFLGRLDEESMDAIIAFRPQSCIGDRVVQILYLAEDDPNWPKDKARIALNVHDALIGLVHKSVAIRCLRILKRIAEQPMMINGYEMIIPAETKISQPDAEGKHRWSTLKEVNLK